MQTTSDSYRQAPLTVRARNSRKRVRGAVNGSTVKTVKGARKYRAFQSATRPQSGSAVAGPVTVTYLVSENTSLISEARA